MTTEYYDSQGQHIANELNYDPSADSYDDAYSLGTTLSGNYFETEILHNAVAGGHLPSDPSGLYILTISPDVSLPDNVWCAYHAYSPEIIPGHEVTYAIAADPPVGILGGCSGNIAIYHDKVSPNFDLGMDSVADSLIHELAETASDPLITAWFTFNGQEMADVCNFNYGPTFLAPNGSHANQKFGNRDYLVQQLWSMENPVACVGRTLITEAADCGATHDSSSWTATGLYAVSQTSPKPTSKLPAPAWSRHTAPARCSSSSCCA